MSRKVMPFDMKEGSDTAKAIFRAMMTIASREDFRVNTLATARAYWLRLNENDCKRLEHLDSKRKLGEELVIPHRHWLVAITTNPQDSDDATIHGFCGYTAERCYFQGTKSAIVCSYLLVKAESRRTGCGTLLVRSLIIQATISSGVKNKPWPIFANSDATVSSLSFFSRCGFEFCYVTNVIDVKIISNLKKMWLVELLQNKKIPAQLSDKVNTFLMTWSYDSAIRDFDAGVCKKLWPLSDEVMKFISAP